MNKIDVEKWPYADENELNAIQRVLNSNCWWRNQGKEVKAFEEEFAMFHNCSRAFSVTNGTAAIEISLKALNISNGDEVIVPAFTFFSTISAVLAVGAKPVLIDISKDTLCINECEIENAITNKTKAIIVVHMAGNICDIDTVNAIAKKYNLHVIEDAAHAHGGEYKRKKVGSLSTCATFSFQNAKIMTAGEGGIITCNDNSLYQNVLLESNCGRAENDSIYEHVKIGTNARLTEFQGAILREQLKRLDMQNKKRHSNYLLLLELMQNFNGIRFQKINENVTCNSHYMIMFYYDKTFFSNKTRKEFVDYLRHNGIPANIAYRSILDLPVISNNKNLIIRKSDCLNSIDASNNVVTIAHNVLLSNEDSIRNIVEVINSFKYC